MKKDTLPRIYHPWWKWECYQSGFYNTDLPHDLTPETAQESYRDFLKDLDAFGSAMDRVFQEWPNSCEHFLTNPSVNRIAWLGQASMCISKGVPSVYRGGFKLLDPYEQELANMLAEEYLDRWMGERCQKLKSA